MKSTCKAFFTIMMVLAGTVIAHAQQKELTAVMANMSANAAQLRHYAYKQRTETYYKGELKSTRLDEIHYAANGERVSIPLSEQRTEAPQRRFRGPGAMIVASKMEQKQSEIKDFVERTLSLSGRYLSPETSRLKTAVAMADISQPGGAGEVRITTRDVAKSGDRMSLVLDMATKRMLRTEVATSLDETPVSIVVSFDTLQDGATYPGRVIVRSESEKVEVRMLTYDYRPLEAGKGVSTR